MSYINESLSQNEEIFEIYKLHWFSRIPLWIYRTITILFFMPFALMSFQERTQEINDIYPFFLSVTSFFLMISIYEYYRLKSIEYGATNKRTISKTGIISRKTEEMKIGSIETVEINQGIIGRIFGFGTIKITGRGISNLIYKNIDNPMDVKKSIEGIEHIQKVCE